MRQAMLCFIILFFTPETYTKNVVQISIPKTGTHLLLKCIWSIRNKNLRRYEIPIYCFIADTKKFEADIRNKKYWANHLFFNKDFEPYLNNDKNAFFFIYRDPRDQIVSFAYFMRKIPRFKERANKISLDKLIMEIIRGGKIFDNHPVFENKTINDLYQEYMPWLYAPNVCVLKFEDLVGPKGGGNLEAQHNCFKKIAKHLGVSLTERQIQKRAKSLFGEGLTFRKGQIGSWKKNFNEDHKVSFKEIAGKLLIDLGYEESFDW